MGDHKKSTVSYCKTEGYTVNNEKALTLHICVCAPRVLLYFSPSENKEAHHRGGGRSIATRAPRGAVSRAVGKSGDPGCRERERSGGQGLLDGVGSSRGARLRECQLIDPG
jgi:hypothetical protein